MNAFTVVTVVFAATAAASLRAQWGPVTVNAPPDARSEHLLAFDAIGNRTLMFGGEFTNSFWSHSGGQWTQLVPATLPGPRARANMAANLFTGEVLLYGGQDGANSFALDETWRWDGTTWQQLAPARVFGA